MNQRLWLTQPSTPVKKRKEGSPCPKCLQCEAVGENTWNTLPALSEPPSCNKHEEKLGVLLKIVVITKPYIMVSLPPWSFGLIDVELSVAALLFWEADFWGKNTTLERGVSKLKAQALLLPHGRSSHEEEVLSSVSWDQISPLCRVLWGQELCVSGV